VTALPVVLVGAGRRAAVHAMAARVGSPDGIRVVGVVSRSADRAAALAADLGVPWSLDLDAALTWGARGAIVSVTCHENHRVAGGVLDLGLPALLETPLAMEWSDALALARRVRESGLPVEVAEQNPRFPEAMLWREIVRRARLGALRAVSSEGAGYRYHAAAVARALFNRGPGRVATGQRALTGVDLGRGVSREPLLFGQVRTTDDRVFSLRDGEGHHLGRDAPWLGAGWTLLGDRGSLRSGAPLRAWSAEGAHDLELTRVSDRHGRLTSLETGDREVHVAPPCPGADLDDDGQAVVQCHRDWLDRLDGRVTGSAWSADDALTDLAWVEGIERSARLLGAPIELSSLLGE